jgi:hypothetical protein
LVKFGRACFTSKSSPLKKSVSRPGLRLIVPLVKTETNAVNLFLHSYKKQTKKLKKYVTAAAVLENTWRTVVAAAAGD